MWQTKKQFSFHDSDIITMDETVVWNDMVSNTNVTVTGSNEVPAKLTGHDTVHMSVYLTGKEDGSKCKPFILSLKEPKEKANFFKKILKILSTSTSIWMNGGWLCIGAGLTEC